jgi:hypothetical protein
VARAKDVINTPDYGGISDVLDSEHIMTGDMTQKRYKMNGSRHGT